MPVKKVKITNIEDKLDKNDKIYLYVTWDDGTHNNIFDDAMMENTRGAYDNKQVVELETEKDGRFWKVVRVTPQAISPAQKIANEHPSIAERGKPAKTTKAMIDPTDTYEVVKARAMALSYSKDKGSAIVKVDGESSDEDDITRAKRYLKFIAMGD